VLKTITKKEMQDHFEKVFFSAESMRIDLEMTAKKHAEEQAKVREENKEHEIFKLLKRVHVTDDMHKFKKSMGLHPNVVKSNFLAAQQK